MRPSTVGVFLFMLISAFPLYAAPPDETLTRAVAQARLDALVKSLGTGTLATVSAGDANGDGVVTVADIFYLINFLFTGGPPPVALAGGGFTWQGPWSNATTYAVNDVVSFNGSSYISITASNLAHQPDTSPANWNLMAQAGANFTGAAAGGDLSGTYPNPAVARVGGQTAANVASGAVLANAATNLNTASTIVRRDASGNFSAGTVTLAGALALPATTSSSVGVITLGGSPFVHNFGIVNTFLGQSAGNFTMTGNSNTATGNTALINNVSGNRNTASGSGALFSNTSGASNTAIGAGALASNTTGSNNTAISDQALFNNTDGSVNTAIGVQALFKNSTGYENIAIGLSALFSNTTGFQNTAIGDNALVNNTTGLRNIAIGQGAGQLLTTGIDNIDIGNSGAAADSATIRIGRAGAQTSAFIAGIRGVTTGSANAIAVLIDSNGQLGTASSSRRYKFDIAGMGEATSGLMRLRPVSFRYLAHGESAPLQYGLIAEEVAEVYPELVARNKDGEVETIMYQFLAPMLLNEAQKQHRTIEEQQKTIDALSTTVDVLGQRLQTLERQLANNHQ